MLGYGDRVKVVSGFYEWVTGVIRGKYKDWDKSVDKGFLRKEKIVYQYKLIVDDEFVLGDKRKKDSMFSGSSTILVWTNDVIFIPKEIKKSAPKKTKTTKAKKKK